MRTFRRVLSALSALCLALAAVACSSTPGSGEKTLVVYDGSSGQFTLDFNPYTPTPISLTWGLVYQPLMYVNLGRADDVRPLLATGYEWAPDGKTLTFTLRENLKWSDGQPITVDDVLYVFNTLETDPTINAYSVPYAGATASDASHVHVHFTRPAYTYFWYVAGKTWIVPKHIWASIADPARDPNAHPVGSGPYQLKNFSPQSIELTRNPGYWDIGKPKVPAIRWVSFNGNQAAVNAVVNDQVHWEGGFIPDIDNTYVAKNPSAHKYLNTPQLITVLVPNFDAGPASDLAVRQAIYTGIDRDQLNRSAFSGYDTPASPGLLLTPRDKKWEPADIGTTPAHDAAKAENYLKAAGYTKGVDGIYVSPKGTKLSIGVKVVSGWTDWISAVQVMKAQLAEIGIDLQPQAESQAAYTSDMENGRFDMVVTNLYGGPEPYYLYNDFLRSANTKPIGEVAQHNFARYRDATTDQALDTIAGTDDENVKKAQYAIVEHQVTKNLPYVAIMQSSTLTEFNVGEFSGWPSQDDLYALPMPFYGPDMGIVAANLEPK